MSISFWVAQGMAISQGTDHGWALAWKDEPAKAAAYSSMRPRRLFFRSLIQSSFSWVKPSGSWMKPPESDSVTGLAPRCSSFSAAWVATLPEPDTTAVMPSTLVPAAFIMFCRKYTAP